MSPGLEPFMPALTLPAWLCEGCGFWQRSVHRPDRCPLCLDARHVPPPSGWSFLTLAEAQAAYPMAWTELEPGVWRFRNEPAPGIGPCAYLLTTPHGNVLWEGGGVFGEDALDAVAALGGVQVLSASHPHSYGALFQIQDRFAPELVIHPGDLEWSGALRVTWPFDDAVEVLPGMRVVHTGVHFAGHAVLLDERRGILLCGDAMKLELDPADERSATAISSHKAFVRGVPLTPAEARRYREVFARLRFTQIWTPFEQGADVGRPEALALFDVLLATRPHADPVPVTELRAAVTAGLPA